MRQSQSCRRSGSRTVPRRPLISIGSVPLAHLPLAERVADVPAIAAVWLLRRAQESRRSNDAVPVDMLTITALSRLMTHK